VLTSTTTRVEANCGCEMKEYVRCAVLTRTYFVAIFPWCAAWWWFLKWYYHRWCCKGDKALVS